MIYTVTLNPSVDYIVRLPSFEAGRVNRADYEAIVAGGKGINVSKCLKALKTDSVAAMLLAGEAGAHLAQMVRGEKLTVLQAHARGQTRTNLKIIDPALGKNTDINEPGPVADGKSLQTLLDLLLAKIGPGDLAVLSGSLPKGAPVDTYRRWIEAFHARGAKVFLDADGPCMAEGIQAAPDLVKPNETELSRLLQRPLNTREELLAGGEELLNMGISNAVISMGGDGALFLWKDGMYFAKSLSVPVRSTVGAGDSVVAAMAYGLEKKLPRLTKIRLAMAMGAASVMQSGSQAPEAETVWALAQQVEITQLK